MTRLEREFAAWQEDTYRCKVGPDTGWDEFMKEREEAEKTYYSMWSEAKLKNNVKAWLKRHNYGVLRWNAGAVRTSKRFIKSQSGVSDLLVCVEGQLYCIELKRHYAKLRKEQIKFLSEWETYGAKCLVLDPVGYMTFKRDFPHHITKYDWRNYGQ